MTRQCNTVEFNFKDLESLDLGLQSLVCSRPPPFLGRTRSHLRALDALAAEWNIPEPARTLAQDLAQGDAGFLVVLLEPPSINSSLTPEEVYDTSPTLQAIDKELQFATIGRMNWHNTSIVDVRPFRSADVRDGASKKVRSTRDERAYRCFEEFLDEFNPTIILAAQCRTKDAQNPYAKLFSSSINRFGVIDAYGVVGDEKLIVRSFHPSIFSDYYLEQWAREGEYAREKVITQNRLLRAAFRLSMLVAVNAVHGRAVSGSGIYNLQMAVRNKGPIARVIHDNDETRVVIDYEYVDESCVTSPEFVAELDILEGTNNSESTWIPGLTVDRVLARLARCH